VGPDACPFTTLYWDFLDRHEDRLRSNHRMGFQYRNVDRKREKGELQPILDRARWLKGWVTRGERI
jgi:deoxyribodipyrimidine photolyase-related protein